MSLIRTPSAIAAAIPINTALSNVINMSDYSGGSILIPAAWTAAAIAFKVCDSAGGTFAPLYNQVGVLVEISGIQTAAVAAYPLPDELFGCLYFKLWSETAGSDTNQTTARSLVVILKG